LAERDVPFQKCFSFNNFNSTHKKGREREGKKKVGRVQVHSEEGPTFGEAMQKLRGVSVFIKFPLVLSCLSNYEWRAPL
jgi:hypothetical protein